jgi:hypothetical protein
MKTVTTFLGLSFALLAVACGGANASDATFAEPSDTGASATDTSAPGTDGAMPGTDSGTTNTDSATAPVDTGPMPPPVTAENVCQKLADAVCTSSLATCCGKRGIEYKESGCKAAIMADCGDKQDAVKAGDTTLNLAAFDACVGAWSTLTTKCTTSILEFVKTYPPCNQLFNGTTPFGSSCAEDWECKVNPGAFGSCSSDNRCDSVTVVGSGAPCGVIMGNRAFCDVGLFCNYTSSTSGTCKETKVGNPCTDNYQCGYGNYCSRPFGSSGTCAAGLAAGAMCGFNSQCASGTCASNRCTDPNVSLASREICTGAGG